MKMSQLRCLRARCTSAAPFPTRLRWLASRSRKTARPVPCPQKGVQPLVRHLLDNARSEDEGPARNHGCLQSAAPRCCLLRASRPSGSLVSRGCQMKAQTCRVRSSPGLPAGCTASYESCGFAQASRRECHDRARAQSKRLCAPCLRTQEAKGVSINRERRQKEQTRREPRTTRF